MTCFVAGMGDLLDFSFNEQKSGSFIPARQPSLPFELITFLVSLTVTVTHTLQMWHATSDLIFLARKHALAVVYIHSYTCVIFYEDSLIAFLHWRRCRQHVWAFTPRAIQAGGLMDAGGVNDLPHIV